MQVPPYAERNGSIAFLRLCLRTQKKKSPTKKEQSALNGLKDGLKVKSLKKVTLPCVIAKMNVKIISDVVDADIPLLLSKTAMKRARMTLNFNNDTAEMFGKRIKLLCTTMSPYPNLHRTGVSYDIFYF